MNDHVRFTVPEFLSHAECVEWIARVEAIGFSDAPITTSRGFVFDNEVRNNTRVMFDDPATTNELWRRLAPYISAHTRHDGVWVPIGLNERLRFYRYEVGQVFRWHLDGAFVRALGEVSLLTFMIYLNADFEGGVTEFEDGVVVPHEGEALVFTHRVLHQGATVTRGVKYVLRSDVMFRRQS
jgi:prolyl 4-hydroxylase